jgi:selenocysteine-specific elongation factor
LDNQLQSLLSKKWVIQTDKENRNYIHQKSFEQLKRETTGHLKKYHQANTLKAGMPKEELKSKYPSLSDPKIFNLILNQMIKGGEIVQEEKTVRLKEHTVSLATDQADIRDEILAIYLESGLQPPYFREICKNLNRDAAKTKDVLMLLVEKGRVVKTKDDLYFHTDAVTNLKNKLVKFLETNGEITTPQFKEMTGVSRKYVIPLIEYFDASKVTLRVGDVRKLRRG